MAAASTDAVRARYAARLAQAEATHTRLAAAVRAEATGRTVHDSSDLASGEPSGFADVVEEAIDYLDLMAEAHVGFSDRNITIAGRATTPGSYRTLTAYLETWAPSGFNVQSSIDLPVVTPYTLTASRMAGRVTVTGFAPDDTARDIIADAATSQSQGPAVVEVTLAVDENAPCVDATCTVPGCCPSGTVA